MKYYVYASESKIDMLFAQISQSEQERREASVGSDLKLFKFEKKFSRGIPENKFTRLNAIIKRLDKEKLIGSFEESLRYIRGTLEMVWATYGDPRVSLITYWGYLSDTLALGLAGSRYHLLGEQRGGSTASASATHSFVEWVHHDLDISEDDLNKYFEEFSKPYRTIHPITPEEFRRTHVYPFQKTDVADAVWLAANVIKGEKSIFEFIAKVLHRSDWPDGYRNSSIKHIILATPLYVSLEE